MQDSQAQHGSTYSHLQGRFCHDIDTVHRQTYSGTLFHTLSYKRPWQSPPSTFAYCGRHDVDGRFDTTYLAKIRQHFITAHKEHRDRDTSTHYNAFSRAITESKAYITQLAAVFSTVAFPTSAQIKAHLLKYYRGNTELHPTNRVPSRLRAELQEIVHSDPRISSQVFFNSNGYRDEATLHRLQTSRNRRVITIRVGTNQQRILETIQRLVAENTPNNADLIQHYQSLLRDLDDFE